MDLRIQIINKIIEQREFTYPMKSRKQLNEYNSKH